MTKIEAIIESIKHWINDILPNPEKAHRNDLHLSHHCPLCQWSNTNCDICPVYEKTQKPSCIGSPWMNFNRNPNQENAIKEIIFLLNILPKVLKEYKEKLKN